MYFITNVHMPKKLFNMITFYYTYRYHAHALKYINSTRKYIHARFITYIHITDMHTYLL